jgi:hypothetical protein
MNVQQTVKQQIEFWHGTLEQMIGECADVLHKDLPGSTTNTIAATYAHTVAGEDVIVHAFLQGKTSLFESNGWGDKTGVPFIGVPPMLTPEWSAKINMKLDAFREYAQTVYAATSAYLDSVPDDELNRKMQTPLGEQTVGWVVTLLLATHLPGHAGEIAALKGVHGLKGLPF